MASPIVGQRAAIPSGDGAVNLYVSAEAKAQGWFNQNRRGGFVNGMANSPANHMESALALSLLQGCPVVGIYNQTDGFWLDLGQCIADKISLVGAQAGSFAAWKLALDTAYLAAKAVRPGLSKVSFVGGLVLRNKATHSLYQYITEMPVSERAALNIFSHSQGNLIVSNALTAAALALGGRAIMGMEVNSFGSPCRYWPQGLKRTNNAFTFDPVSWLDYSAGFSSVKVGFTKGIVAHGFDIYMKHDAEFIVNRFRWGSFRMTASMDEAGLAKYLVGIGHNPPRLKAIFKWLDDKHNSDADDVAVLYCKAMRTQHPSTFAAIARDDKSLVELLIRCMEEGWTSADEKTEIRHLKTLI